MQTQNRILQAMVVLMALMLIVGIADAQKKKAKKTTPPVTLPPEPPGDPRPVPVIIDDYYDIDVPEPPRVTEEPDKSDFVSVEVEPYPITDIQSLVEYPEEAKKAGLEGKVIISALIDTSGKVIKVEIDRTDNQIFNESARKALMKARFTPALQNTKPVKLWYTVPIMYKLKKSSDSTSSEIIVGVTEVVNNIQVISPILKYPEGIERYRNVSVDVEPQPLQDIYSLVEYPEEAKKAGLEGRIVVYALIDTSGTVIQVETDNSGFTILEESAKKAMLKVQFSPAIKDGKAIQYWYTMPVLFKPYTIGQ